MTIKTLSALALSIMAVACPIAIGQDNTPEDETAIMKSNESGLTLIKELSQKGNRNIAVSPLSINGMFALLQRGSAGTTLGQIERTLGNTVVLQEACARLFEHDKRTTISNMIVVDNDLKLNPDYRKGIPSDELRTVNFKADPDKERSEINSWVEQNTKGEIKDLLPSGSLTKDTVMVALNAIVFEGTWANEFNASASREGTFHADGRDIKAMLMNRTGAYPHTRDKQETTIVALPYADTTGGESPLSFVVFMPREGVSLKDYLAGITPQVVREGIKSLKSGRDIHLQLPKFEIKTPTMALSGDMKQMGVTDIFEAGKADLSRLSPEKGLYLSEIFHQCFIKVDEKGTKAAAGTAGVIMKMSMPPSVILNRPFLWFICDLENDMVLFCGTLDDPSPEN